jgi:phosphatidylglycerophosphate synthase
MQMHLGTPFGAFLDPVADKVGFSFWCSDPVANKVATNFASAILCCSSW